MITNKPGVFMSKSLLIASVVSLAAVVSAQAEPRKAPQVSMIDRVAAFPAIPQAMENFVGGLSASSDFSVFLDKACPEDLHRMALRKLWKTLPDGAVEQSLI